MAGFWSKIVKSVTNFVTGRRELPKPKPKVKPTASPRKLPRSVARETREQGTPTAYIKKLHELTTAQDRVRSIEATMFDESLPEDIRKAALDDYFDETGWWRPEHTGDWSSDEWQRWEQIYESEPEVF